MLPLLATTVFLGAALIFLIQPLVAKLLLPLLGGSPAVWNTCMVFFQTVLLAGYAYAHALTRLRPHAQVGIHAAVLLAPLIALPIALPADAAPPAEGGWTLWLLQMLILTAGLPAFAAATTAPLVQRWFSTTSHAAARDPYFLYAASNAGSLLALLAFPVVLEPMLTLRGQAWAWAAVYGAYLAAMAAGMLAMRRAGGLAAAPSPQSPPTAAADAEAGATRPSWRERALWLLLAMTPSSLLLGVTTHISTDVASAPLLWILPLSIYLLTFINAFARRPLVSAAAGVWALPVLAVGAAVLSMFKLPAGAVAAAHLAVLAAAGIACHGHLAARRPHASRLTEFYLILALGGALGGAFNSLVAPVVFTSIVEYPLVLAAACLLAALAARPTERLHRPRLALAAIGATAFSLLWAHKSASLPPGVTTLYTARTFFGVHRVTEGEVFRNLRHGTTLHGTQFIDPRFSFVPQSYYHPSGPIGRIFLALEKNDRIPRSIGIVGLGAGSLAAYAAPQAQVDFFEIDPAVVHIASNPSYFTYLRDGVGAVRIIGGDARLSLSRQPDASYDLLILDAFSSDAIPIHLVTREALREYVRTLRPGGLIAVHISNRYFDLLPMMDAVARAEGLEAIFAIDTDLPDHPLAVGKQESDWAVIARSPEDLALLTPDPMWRRLAEPRPLRPWTDDYSNILSVLRWRSPPRTQ